MFYVPVSVCSIPIRSSLRKKKKNDIKNKTYLLTPSLVQSTSIKKEKTPPPFDELYSPTLTPIPTRNPIINFSPLRSKTNKTPPPLKKTIRFDPVHHFSSQLFS